MRRRTFVGWLMGGGALLAGAVAAGWGLLFRPGSSPRDDGDGVPLGRNGRAVLPKRYAQSLQALVVRLYPDEAGAPGAAAADAFGYILKQLALPEMAATRAVLIRGAAQLDRVARAEVGTVFLKAGPQGQDRVVTAMLAGAGAAKRFAPQRFIQTMVGLVLEGMFCDPCHGGNRGGVGWLSIGYPMHPPQPTCGHGDEGGCGG